jgi:GntR family transcriptional regulator/MocR family aminotransferase
MGARIAAGSRSMKGQSGKKSVGQSRADAAGAMDPLFEIKLDLPAAGARGTAKMLHQQLKAAILDGRLAAGARLPPMRRSKTYFGVSRNTAAEIYEQLASEGLIVSRRGSGAYVAERPVATTRPAATSLYEPDDPRLNPIWTGTDITDAMGFWRDPEDADGAAGQIELRPALVDARLFPFDLFRQVSARQLRGLERKPARFRSPYGNQGNYRLRDAITRHIALTRGVVCNVGDVLVTSGAQQAFDLLARVLVRAGETVVAIEDPGYPPMRAAFAAAGAKVVPVGVDGEGLIVEDLPEAAGIVCVCPSHQFPLGVAMSPERRKELLAWARRSGAVIVEDDYDGEFRFEGGPLEALRSADNADVVFYVGTFSKCMLPALRIGFVVAPGWALRTLAAAKNCMDWHCSTPIQLGIAGFIAEGWLTRHVRRMRETYRRRRKILLEMLETTLGDRLEAIPSFYGMHVTALARDDTDLEAAAKALAQQGVKIHSLSRYHLGPANRAGLVFGFGTADAPELREGLARLKKVLGRG